MAQLALDLSGGNGTVLDLSGRRRVELTTRVRTDEVEVELSAGSGRAARIQWRLGPEPELVVHGHLRSLWWMVDAPTWALGRRTSDVLDSVTDWVWREAHGWSAGDAERGEREAARRCAGPLHAQLRSIQRAVLARCAQQAREAAARFRPSQRFAVYRWLATDPTGRLAQLATTMPGLVIFALWMRMTGLDALVGDLARRIVAGERPRLVLRELLAAWRDASAPDLTDAELESRRVLIERAPAWVDPLHLLMPTFTPVLEDIPEGRVAAAAWYRVVARLLTAAGEAASDIAPFVSRHALALGAAAASGTLTPDATGGPDRELARLGSLLATVVRVRRRPLTRDQGVRPTLELAVGVADLADAAGCTFETRFPAPPLPDRQSGAVHIRAMRDTGELVGESVRMRHCAAYLAARIVGGGHAVYHAEVDGESLTVHVAQVDGVWMLLEIAGTANRPPSRRGYREVLRWLADGLEEPR